MVYQNRQICGQLLTFRLGAPREPSHDVPNTSFQSSRSTKCTNPTPHVSVLVPLPSCAITHTHARTGLQRGLWQTLKKSTGYHFESFLYYQKKREIPKIKVNSKKLLFLSGIFSHLLFLWVMMGSNIQSCIFTRVLRLEVAETLMHSNFTSQILLFWLSGFWLLTFWLFKFRSECVLDMVECL